MNEQHPISSDELARYVSGEASALERAAVERWAEADPANRRELEAMRTIWEQSDGTAPEPDVDAAWTKVQERIANEGRGGRVIQLWNGPLRWAAAAAVVVGLFAVARWLTMPDQVIMASVQEVTTTLPDSSRVVLAPGGRLDVRMDDQRQIGLHGKAWFEVERDTEHPFVVRSGDLVVTVLGTGFEVSAYDTAAVWAVRVRHGRVRVEAGQQRIELNAGQRITYDRSSNALRASTPVTSETWGARIVRFENAPMTEVVQRLQEMYHVRIDLGSGTLGRCRLTATFENEQLDQVLYVIASTFGMEVVRPAKDHVVLHGEGC